MNDTTAMTDSAPTGAPKTSTRSPRRTVIGSVISDKMSKTLSVRVSRKVKHPKYGKYVTRLSTYQAHDEAEQAKTGDTVEIAFARRLSKTKCWRLVRIVSSARVVAVRGEEELAALPGKQAPTSAPKAAAKVDGAEGGEGKKNAAPESSS
jgi:small subunit ribosomal protein S17